MIERWREAQRLHAASMDGQRGEPRYGLVTSADLVRWAVRVTYQPSGALSGWLQMVTPWCGGGWGLLAMPPIGAQVVVVPVEGDAEQCIVLGATFNDQDAAPAGYTEGEFWLVHRSGSFLKLQADGTVQVKGDLHVDGDVFDRHGSLDRLRGHHNSHVHPNVQPGGANTPVTPQQDPE